MKKERKHYAAEEKVAILRRHLLDKVPVSDLCEEVGLRPTVFYRWQKEFFENGAAAFQAVERPHRQAEEKQKRIAFLEKKVQTMRTWFRFRGGSRPRSAGSFHTTRQFRQQDSYSSTLSEVDHGCAQQKAIAVATSPSVRQSGACPTQPLRCPPHPDRRDSHPG